MKVITFTDGDGHSHAVECTLESLRALIEFLLRENEMNTIFEEPAGAKKLLADSESDETHFEDWLRENGPLGRYHAVIMDIVEVKGAAFFEQAWLHLS